MEYHQVAEEIEYGAYCHYEGIRLRVGAEKLDNAVGFGSVVGCKRIDKLEVVEIFAESDIPFDRFGRYRCAAAEGYGQFVDFVVKPRHIGADIFGQHRQALRLNSETFFLNESLENPGNGRFLKLFRFEDNSVFAYCGNEVFSFCLLSAT